MYLGRIASFLIGEAAAVAVGAARGALDLYEEVLRVKRTYHPPYHERFKEPEFQLHYGRALGARSATAEAALIRAGEDYMDYARAEARRRRAVRRREGPAAHPDRAAGHPPCLGGHGADLPHRRHLGRRQARRHDRAHLPQHGGDQHPPGAAASTAPPSMRRAPASASCRRQIRLRIEAFRKGFARSRRRVTSTGNP